MGIGIKDFLETELLSHNGQDANSNAAEASVEDSSKQRTGHDSDGQEPSRLALKLLAIRPPNKWRGNKIKVHDKEVIQAQKQERSTQNLRKAQSRKDKTRSEQEVQEQTAGGSMGNAQVDLPEDTGAPGNVRVVNGRWIYTIRNGLISCGLGRSGLKRGKKTKTSGLTGLTTPPLPAKRPDTSPKKSPAIKSRAHGSSKKRSKKSPTEVQKRKQPEVDSEGEHGNRSKRRYAAASERPEKGQVGEQSG